MTSFVADAFAETHQEEVTEEKVKTSPDFNLVDLMSTRLRVPSRIDFASGVGLAGNTLDNYGNPADISLSHSALNLSFGEIRWPFLGYHNRRYVLQQTPFNIGIGVPIGDSCIATTLLIDYFRYDFDLKGQESNRKLLGGDFHVSYNKQWGISSHWLTSIKSLTPAEESTSASRRDESLFGMRVGGRFGGLKYGWVARFDTYVLAFLKSRRLELSVILPDYSLGFIHTEHFKTDYHQRTQRVMWNSGMALRVSRRYAYLIPLWIWLQGRVSVTVGEADGELYLDWQIECSDDCGPFWEWVKIIEIEGHIGCEYQLQARHLTLTVQTGFVGSTDRRVWNEGIFHPAGWGHIGLSFSIIHQNGSDKQLAYTIGYEHLLPYFSSEIPPRKFGFHQRVEWRRNF